MQYGRFFPKIFAIAVFNLKVSGLVPSQYYLTVSPHWNRTGLVASVPSECVWFLWDSVGYFWLLRTVCIVWYSVGGQTDTDTSSQDSKLAQLNNADLTICIQYCTVGRNIFHLRSFWLKSFPTVGFTVWNLTINENFTPSHMTYLYLNIICVKHKRIERFPTL